jgi:hypothetical protein
MFEQATREKIRFNYHGSIGVEDLWDLTESQLNELYIQLSRQKKTDDVEALINSREDKVLKLKMDLVKHVFDVKRTESKAAKDKAAKKAQKEKILEVLHKKSETALENKSVEELEAMLLDEDESSAG